MDTELQQQRSTVQETLGTIDLPDVDAAVTALVAARGRARVRLLDRDDVERLVERMRQVALATPPDARGLLYGRAAGGKVANAYSKLGVARGDVVECTVERTGERAWRLVLSARRSYAVDPMDPGVDGNAIGDAEEIRQSLRDAGFTGRGGRWTLPG